MDAIQTVPTHGAEPARSTSPHAVVVVGAGASGLATVAAIAKRFSENPISDNARLTIMWLDEKDPGEFGPGSVYLSHESMYDLNVPAKQMSIFKDDPSHFVRWLENSGGYGYGENDFIPRSIYSEYLRNCAEDIIRNVGLHHNITVVAQSGKVKNIEKNGRFKIFTGEDAFVPADQVVLAIGHEPGEDPFEKNLDRNPQNYYRIMDTSTHARAMQSLPKGWNSIDKKALIVGFGSSAIDRIRLLDHAGYQGEIVVVTRHGMRPWPYQAEHDGKEFKVSFGIQDVMKLAKEYVTADNRKRTAAIEKFVDLLQEEVGKAQANDRGPQNFLYSPELAAMIKNPELTYVSPQFASEAEKIVALFKANPTPPTDAKLIAKYEQEGRLKVIIGEIVNPPSIQDGKIKVMIEPRGGEKVTETFDVVFEGSPYARNYKSHSLLTTIFNKGLGRMNRETGLVERDDSGQSRGTQGVYILGAAASPVWGIETFRAHAAAIADAVVKRIAERDLHANGNVNWAAAPRVA